MWSPLTPITVWECDSVQLFFSAFSANWSLWDFTTYSVLQKPGVLAASAHTLFWGVPTFAVLQWFSWSNMSFLSISLLLGSASVVVGSLILRLLFGSGVALCFAIIFAVNPSLVYNMGYGVAQTGTLFAVLLAALFTLRALYGQGPIWLNVILAILFLFGGTLNYGPGRVFIVATLIFLAGVVGAALLWRRLPKKLTFTALTILIGATAFLITENRINRSTDFTSMRGEQVFHQHHYPENLIRLLGDTPEVRKLDPNNLPLSYRALFILKSAEFCFEQFRFTFSPFNRLRDHRRPPSLGNEARPYQSGLFIFMMIGLVLSTTSVARALLGRSSSATLGHAYIFSFFLLGLGPLLLVNRLDQHRSFILVVPMCIWAALGMWACLQRMYAHGTPRLLIGGFGIAIALSLSASTWHVLGTQEYRSEDLSAAISQMIKTEPPGSVLGASGMNCQEVALVEFAMANLMKDQPSSSRLFIPVGFMTPLSDQNFDSAQGQFENYMSKFGSQRVTFVNNISLTKFEQAVVSRGLSVQKTAFGAFSAWIIDPPSRN
jgi:hypothetical protein